LDLSSSEGLEKLEQLGLVADVIVDSFRPGKLERGSLKDSVICSPICAIGALS